MAKRLFDLSVAIPLLVITMPLWLATMVAIRLSSPGPVFYRARRVGRNAVPFVMYKFRTMHVSTGPAGSSITGSADPRVFALGRALRHLKIDELPQLFNIVLGHMSICGPRPEAEDIVQKYYQPWHLPTLSVRPGLVSPGSLFNYTHGDDILQGACAEQAYAERLLPIKLAIELVYLRRATLGYDVRLLLRTAGTIVAKLCGRRHFEDPPEMYDAQWLLAVQRRAAA